MRSEDRSHGAAAKRSVRTTNRNPTTSAPVTFTTNVLHGNAAGVLELTAPSSAYRARAPTAPATAMPTTVLMRSSYRRSVGAISLSRRFADAGELHRPGGIYRV